MLLGAKEQSYLLPTVTFQGQGYSGLHGLKETSLASLGITRGSCLLRVSHGPEEIAEVELSDEEVESNDQPVDKQKESLIDQPDDKQKELLNDQPVDDKQKELLNEPFVDRPVKLLLPNDRRGNDIIFC